MSQTITAQGYSPVLAFDPCSRHSARRITAVAWWKSSTLIQSSVTEQETAMPDVMYQAAPERPRHAFAAKRTRRAHSEAGF
jgi:hypothetical protein